MIKNLKVTRLLIIMLIVVGSVLCGGCVSGKSQAQTETSSNLYTGKKNEIVMTIGKKTAYVDGKAVQNDVSPIISGGRTMLPARFVAEELGAAVKWDQSEKRIDVIKDDVTITMYVGSNTAYINNNPVLLDTQIFIKDSRTYTPVRFIAENLNAKVEWLQETKQVVINKNGYVLNQVSYHEPVSAPYESWQHDIDIPMLNSNTQGAKTFNQNIFDMVTRTLKSFYSEGKFCKSSYTYLVSDGIVGIIVDVGVYRIGAGGMFPTYAGFFYDTKKDIQLTPDQYYSLLGISRKAVAEAVNLQKPVYIDNVTEKDVQFAISNGCVTYALCSYRESETGMLSVDTFEVYCPPVSESTKKDSADTSETVSVVTAESYTKEMSHQFNPSYLQQIEIPKITGSSRAVLAFNEKIMKKHGDVIDICKNGKDDGKKFVLKYWYKVYDGVVGIIILDARSTIGSFYNSLYYGYYFDANNDKELSYAEYLTLLQISEKDMVKNINLESPEMYPGGGKAEYGAKSISATIYDGIDAIAVVPDDFAGQYTIDFKYTVTANVFEKAEPNPALEAELALVKYVDENSNEFYQDEYYEPHSLFLADINNDRIPELCVEYWSTAYDSRDCYIEAIKYENGEFVKIPKIAVVGSRGPGIISEYTLYYDHTGKLYFEEKTEECNVFSDAQDYVYNVCIYSFDESANREIAKKYTSAIIDGEYYYDEPGTSGTKVTKEYYLSKMEECDNLRKTLSVIDIPEIANLAVSITDIWELQQSFYLEK